MPELTALFDDGSLLRRIAKRSDTLYRYKESLKNRRRLGFLSKVIAPHGIGAELGVFKGYFTRILLDSTKPQKLYIVDPWYLLEAEWSWAGGNKSTIEALRGILRSFAGELVEKKVEMFVGGDLEFLASKPDGYFDWVYIDTSHQYAHTRHELEILRSKVKPTGVIAGDDWQTNPNHRHHGVCQAVRDFLATEPYELIYGDDRDKQWAIRRRQAPAGSLQ